MGQAIKSIYSIKSICCRLSTVDCPLSTQKATRDKGFNHPIPREISRWIGTHFTGQAIKSIYSIESIHYRLSTVHCRL